MCDVWFIGIIVISVIDGPLLKASFCHQSLESDWCPEPRASMRVWRNYAALIQSVTQWTITLYWEHGHNGWSNLIEALNLRELTILIKLIAFSKWCGLESFADEIKTCKFSKPPYIGKAINSGDVSASATFPIFSSCCAPTRLSQSWKMTNLVHSIMHLMETQLRVRTFLKPASRPFAFIGVAVDMRIHPPQSYFSHFIWTVPPFSRSRR